jgi:hypothetical protein
MNLVNDTSVACIQCGAISTPTTNCRLCFEALLAFGAERPSVFGAVHHLTVAAYSLQHPAGYRHAVLLAWHALLTDALEGNGTVSKIRKRFGEQFAGSTRVLEPGAKPPDGWPAEWPMTVQDVYSPLDELPDAGVYVTRAHAWASATRATLDESRLSWRRVPYGMD